jgi:hypothetical protein
MSKLKETAEERDLKSRIVPGMAHFSGTGPVGTICQTCVWFNVRKARVWERDPADRRKGQHVYVNDPPFGTCQKFKALLGRSAAPQIDQATAACKYWERRP